MKLFQIEEPDGSPQDDADAIGAAVGIDLDSAKGAAVAISVGGNAEPLSERLPVTGLKEILSELRGRAERALSRPVTHAVIAVSGEIDDARRREVAMAAVVAGLDPLRIMTSAEASALARGPDAALLGAAIQAEDDAAPLLPAS